ncbi:MAG: hypothetical protein Q4D61_03045 [Cardiobacteriaceae bacterium]|nr:hypothetical protein [Cardiobacteriaceae bacterium]
MKRNLEGGEDIENSKAYPNAMRVSPQRKQLYKKLSNQKSTTTKTNHHTPHQTGKTPRILL